jgi:DNA-binding transcriptional LysR family regulator
MDVNDLRHFIAVYEAKGFSRASRVIGTVQSNVSGRIRILEKFLGVPLFERRYRAVVPTESGERLYGYAKQVVAVIDQAAREIRPPQ